MIHKFPGCYITPLSSYLKALGLMKIIGEQKDGNARFYWENSIFLIETELSMEQIIDFLIDDYSPSPIMSPWSGGGGFYFSDNHESMDKIVESQKKRFEEYRYNLNIIKGLFPEFNCLSIETVKEYYNRDKDKYGKLLKKTDVLVKKLENIVKDKEVSEANLFEIFKESPELKKDIKEVIKTYVDNQRDDKTLKVQTVKKCRNNLTDRCVEWLDASILVNSENELSFPPLMGSGGNEGHLEYSSFFMECIVYLFIEQKRDVTAELLRNSLLNEYTDNLKAHSFGKFDPGRAGGANQGNAIESKNFKVNYWDFILLMEGALLWSNDIGKRSISSKGNLMTPFTVRISNVGFNSASHNGSSALEKEVWTPIWGNKSSLLEIKVFFTEGRVSLRGRAPKNGLEFAEAINLLGVDRGIDGFNRHLLLVRRGDALVATDVGYLDVKDNEFVNLLNDIESFNEHVNRRLRKIGSDDAVFERNKERIKRGVEEAAYELTLNGSQNKALKLLRAIGRSEILIDNVSLKGVMKKGTDNENEKMLDPEWIVKAYDGTSEFRLALALSSIRVINEENSQGESLWSLKNKQLSWHGDSLYTKLKNVILNVAIGGTSGKSSSHTIIGSVGASVDDITRFIQGITDEKKIVDLLFAFNLVKLGKETPQIITKLFSEREDKETSFAVPFSRMYGMLKMSSIIDKSKKPYGLFLKPDKRIIKLLESGKLTEACRIARINMIINGYIPLNISFPEISSSMREGIIMAAALLIPLRDRDEWDLEKKIVEKKRC